MFFNRIHPITTIMQWPAFKLLAGLTLVCIAANFLYWMNSSEGFDSALTSFLASRPDLVIGLGITALSLLAIPSHLRLARIGASILLLLGALSAMQASAAFFPTPTIGVPEVLSIIGIGGAASHMDFLLEAILFVMLGTSLVLQTTERQRHYTQYLALPIAVIAFLLGVGYLYCRLKHLTPYSSHMPLSPIESILLIFNAIALFLCRPQTGPAGLLVSQTQGGWIFRSMLPFVIGGPVIIGWFQLVGEQSGFIDSSFRIALMMVALAIILCFAPWRTALVLNETNMARRRAESLMQQNERSYRTQFAKSSVPMLMLNPSTGAIIEANSAACAFYGYPRDKILTLKVFDINTLPQEETMRIMKTVKEGKGGRFEFKHRLADGSLRDVAAHTSLIQFAGQNILHSIVIDITDSKQAEAKIREGEERYRLLIENSVAAVATHKIVYDEKGKPVDYILQTANQAFETHTGLRIADVVGTPITKAIPGIENTPLIATYGKVVETGQATSFEFYAANLKRHYLVHAYRLSEGMFATVFSDITARKNAEEAQRSREAFLNLLLETVPIPVFSKDIEGRYVLVNKAFETLFWRNKDQLIGKTVVDITSPETAKTAQEQDARLYESGGTSAYYAQVEDGMGVVHDVIFQKAALQDPDGRVTGIIGAILNISDNKRLEEELKETREELAEALARASRVAKKKA